MKVAVIVFYSYTAVFGGSLLLILLSTCCNSDVCTAGTACTRSQLVLPVLAVFRPSVWQYSECSQYHILRDLEVYSEYELILCFYFKYFEVTANAASTRGISSLCTARVSGLAVF